MAVLRPILLAVLLCAMVLGAAQGDGGDEATPAPACPDRAWVPGVGDSCRTPDGLLAVFGPDGPFQGFTHGPDPIPPEDAVEDPILVDALPAGGLPNAPWCVEASTPPALEPRARLIYARAADDADRYATQAPIIAALARAANTYVYNAGVATGTAAALKVECVGGDVQVHEAVLDTPRASASFSTIVKDLKDLGHGEAAIKHWVYYDDRGACACGGMGHLIPDSTPTGLNLNNGWVSAMFAVTFGYDSTRIMLHELGHNLGAVQTDSPHTTRAGHCTDGRDIMCYNDGGPLAYRYTNTACSVMVWDCGHDDYFHTAAPEGSYLALHWNIGARYNRFVVFADTIDLPVTDAWLPGP